MSASRGPFIPLVLLMLPIAACSTDPASTPEGSGGTAGGAGSDQSGGERTGGSGGQAGGDRVPVGGSGGTMQATGGQPDAGTTGGAPTSPAMGGAIADAGMSTPDTIPAADRRVTVGAGYYGSCFLHAEKVICGKGDRPIATTAVEVALPAPARQLDAGFDQACARLTNGAIYCWQLEPKAGAPAWQPRRIDGLGDATRDIAVGHQHACAISTTGQLRCWGANDSGQLGTGNKQPVDVPALVPLPAPVVAVTASQGALTGPDGGHHTCALLNDGTVHCWGANDTGQLGTGDNKTALQPRAVSRLGMGVRALSAGGAHTCAVLETGDVRCWGSNDRGQLGLTPVGSMVNVPTAVPNLTNIVALALGASHSCFVTASGGAKCMGRNDAAELGGGPKTFPGNQSAAPVDVHGLASGVLELAAGHYLNCVRLSTEFRCWGHNSAAFTGGGPTNGSTPRRVPLP